MKKISQGLEMFIDSALVKSKRERFIKFLASKKGQKKFLSSLDHDLIRYLDGALFITDISELNMKVQGELYCSKELSIESVGSIESLYNKAPCEGGWILVNETGTQAIYRPEGRIDDEIYIKV